MLPTDPSTGDAPLHIAVTHNYDVVATQLLGLGADPGVQDLEGRTAVMRACEYGHVQVLDALATKSINTTGEVSERWFGKNKAIVEEGYVYLLLFLFFTLRMWQVVSTS